MNQNTKHPSAEHTNNSLANELATADRTLLRRSEAAKFLSVSERTLWSLTAPRGALPVVRFGRSVRYRQADLSEWVRRQTQGVA